MPGQGRPGSWNIVYPLGKWPSTKVPCLTSFRNTGRRLRWSRLRFTKPAEALIQSTTHGRQTTGAPLTSPSLSRARSGKRMQLTLGMSLMA